MKPIMKRYKQERHNSNNYDKMKKYIVYLVVFILFSVDGYFIYKSINSFRKINTFKKETALVVETKYAKHGKRGRTYYLKMKLKPTASEGDI